ncbi:MAG: ATP-binding protein, partial [Verrucomicrobiota bacterium]|nr:ATP-binding protein [Verrucomicrobiota bacterium]
EIRAAAKRASTLVGQLLAFSRKHPLEPSVLEVNTLVTNLERSLLRLVGENITIQCDLQREKDGAHIRADREQITQIILNLVVNARDAMPDGGQICLTTATIHFNGDAPEPLTSDDYVAISVRDSGLGMTAEVKARLFEPFFTTKSGAQGSGLGLATSYGIVRQSGGDIRVESEVGAGTTVTIYVPRVSPPAPVAKRTNGKNLPGGKETLLVVEDDIAVRHLAVRVLRGLGYDVIEAANGDDAQRLIEADSDRAIDLLLSDIVMPHMSGHHFADWLRQRRPKTKVIFISGYLDHSINGETQSDGMFFLPKPFDPTQLATKVREALDAKSPRPPHS